MDDLDFQATLEDAFTPVLTQIAESLSGLRDVMAEVATAISDGFSESTAAAGGLRDALAELGGTVQDAAMEMSGNTLALQEQTGALEENTVALQDNAAAQEEQGAAAESSAGANNMAGGSATRAAGTLGLMGLAAAGVGVALTIFGAKAEDSLNLVASLTGASKQQMDQYTTGLEQMSNQLGVTLDSAAQGLYYVVSAGFQGADALKVLKIAMMGAKAGGADMQTTADALTSALNAYGVKADQAANYSDIMITAFTQGKQTFADFAGSVGMAAVTGHTAGISFDQVAAAEATMTQSGLNAHRAVMQLDFMMRSVGLSAGHVGDIAHKLGLSFDTAKFKSLDLMGKLQYLQAISKGNKQDFEKLVGGANGLSAAEILLTNHGKTFNGILDKMHHSSGATSTAFQSSEQKLSASAAHMGAQLSLLAYNFEQLASPVVTAVLGTLGKAFGTLATLIAQHGPAARAILVGLAVVIGGALVAAVTLYGKAALTAAMEQGALIGPILAVAAVVAILVTGVMLAYQHFAWFRDAVQAVGRALAGVVHFFQTNETAMDALKAVLAAAAVAALFFAASAIPPLVVAFGAWAVGAASAAVATIAATWPILAIIAAIAALIFIIIQVVKHWDAIRDAIGRFVSFVTGHVGAFFSWLGTTFHTGWLLAQQAVSNAVKFIQGVVQAGFQLVVTIITAPVRAIVALFSWLYNHNYYFKALVDTITGWFKAAWAFIVNIWTTITSWLASTWNAIKTRAELAWRLLVQTIQHAVTEVYVWLVQHITAVRVWLEQQWARVVATAQAAWSKFVSAISSIVGKVTSAVKGVTDAIFKPIHDLAANAFQWGVNLIQHLIDGITSMAGKVGDAAKNIAKNIAGFLGFHSPTEEGPGSTADRWMPALGTMLVSGLMGQEGPLRNAAQHLAGVLSGALGSSSGLAGAGGAGGGGGAGSTLPLLLAGGGASGASSASDVHVHVHMPDSFVAGTRLLDRATRDQLANELGEAFGQSINIQNRLPYGYTGGR